MSSNRDVRTYLRADCAVFRKTAEAFGGLSNMAPGFPVRINGVRILTVEALYQACRFPHRPVVQRKIIEQSSPMTAKMVGKPFRNDSRPDWDRVRVKIMRWVLRLKLATHWSQFSELLLSTGDLPIVEDSRKDDFWGAVPIGDTNLVGMNVLGRLLMELREEVKRGSELRRVEPPAISDFRLFDEVLGIVDFRNDKSELFVTSAEKKLPAVTSTSLSLFDDEFVEATTKKNSVDPAPKPVVEQRSGMIADLKPYAAYKDSGLASFGLVPTTWEIAPLSRLVRQKVVVGQIDRQLLSVYLNRGVVRFADEGQKRTNGTSEDLSLYQAVDPGDLVLNNQQAWRGSVGVSIYRGIVSPAYFVLTLSKQYSSRYADLLFRERSMVDQYVVCSKGVGTIQRNLYWPHLKRAGVVVPPPEEQAAIVRFLDWANARLERTIRAKRRVIALLTEQKQAIIHRAVTRGLDPTVPLKPSGIAWLGEIPAHWELLRSKYIFKEVDSRSVSGNELHLSMSQKHGLIPSTHLEVRRLVSESHVGAKLCEKGDLILNRLKAHLGVFALAKQSGLISPDYTVLRPMRDMADTYFESVYRTPACRVELHQRAKGIVQGFWRLYTDDFYDIKMPVPPVEEQCAIMSQLEIDLTDVNGAILRMEREIDLLREYRTRLVADVVTGKLDVREAASALPQGDLKDSIEPGALEGDDDHDALEEVETDDEENAT